MNKNKLKNIIELVVRKEIKKQLSEIFINEKEEIIQAELPQHLRETPSQTRGRGVITNQKTIAGEFRYRQGNLVPPNTPYHIHNGQAMEGDSHNTDIIPGQKGHRYLDRIANVTPQKRGRMTSNVLPRAGNNRSNEFAPGWRPITDRIQNNRVSQKSTTSRVSRTRRNGNNTGGGNGGGNTGGGMGGY